ncbi:MAG: hypothetical protein L0241_23240 [Planctomycetia bacterium]|nr:hypothetical protein [Planctomycetia bacterium]
MPDDDEPPLQFPDDFRVAVAAQLAAIGYSVVCWQSSGVDVRPPADNEQQYIGLENLHRRVKASERTEWPRIIREFLDHLTGALQAPAIPDDLTTISARLRPRLGVPFDHKGKTHPWGIPLPGTGLEINLVVDFPHTMAYVTDSMLAKCRQKGEDLLDVAMDNLRSATPGDFFELATEELEIYIGHTGDGYDSARALLVEELLPDSPAGFWVAIPSREQLAVWPVSLGAIARVQVLKMFATENYREHAYPVTDDVFWVWQGTWYRFGITLRDNDLVLDAPTPFGDALRELQSDEPG